MQYALKCLCNKSLSQIMSHKWFKVKWNTAKTEVRNRRVTYDKEAFTFYVLYDLKIDKILKFFCSGGTWREEILADKFC